MNHSILFIAKRDLEVNKRRYRLVRLSIAISVLLIVLVMLISNSFYNKMIKEMTVANKNVVTVAFGNKENSLNYKALPLFSNEDIDRVKKIDEVKNITGVKLLFTDDIKFQNGKTSVSNTIHCLEEKYLKNLNIRIAEGKFPEKDNEILIGDSVHKATSMNVGDTVTIKIDNHYEKFVISGIIDKQEAQLFSTLPTEINQMMAINVNSSSVSSNKYYYLNATVKNGTDLNEVANKIEKNVLKNENLKQSLSGTGLDVVVATQQDVINMLSRWFSYIDLFILLIIVLISIVAIINIINILAITIQENHKQIATFKIIGASDRQIKRIYLFESFMMGVRATSAGLVIGIAISYLIIFLSGLPLDIELTRLLFPVLIGILTSVFAGLLVSRKITKIDIEKVLNQ
ncbi:ABC transporter permease [Streptococcus parasanguinis]|uniref:ABC transporter permease n=1 Tax=Streptococcus parasanguinis TaxID=1318 RepID=UPI0039C21B42